MRLIQRLGGAGVFNPHGGGVMFTDFREREGEKHRCERETSLVACCMHPDRGAEPTAFSYETVVLPPTEPPGQGNGANFSRKRKGFKN